MCVRDTGPQLFSPRSACSSPISTKAQTAVLVPSPGGTHTSYPLSFPHALLPAGVTGKQPVGSWGGGQVDPAVLGVSWQTRQLRALKAEACVWGLNGGGRFNPVALGGGSERLGVFLWQNSCVAVGRLLDLLEPLASSGEA